MHTGERHQNGHRVARLLIRHFHHLVKHHGRHSTAGAIRVAGQWIIGEKCPIASILHKCARCKLRGKYRQILMGDIPDESSTHTTVYFHRYRHIWPMGHFRKTRGGQANSKRWRVLFICLYTRAIHIKVIQELS